MQTICKAVRKQAVCGQKPGGASAYDLRESCVAKEKKPRKPTKKSADTEAVARIKALLTFSRKELIKLTGREKVIITKIRPPPQPLPRPGHDHRIARIFIFQAKDNQHLSVHNRIKAACDKFNEKQGPRSKVEFNYAVERLVIMGALNHYHMACLTLKKELSGP